MPGRSADTCLAIARKALTGISGVLSIFSTLSIIYCLSCVPVVRAIPVKILMEGGGSGSLKI